MSAASTALSEDQKAILKELGTRQESFSPEQKAVYQELSRRMGSSYSGRPLSTLMSSNTPRTKAEQEQVDYALHHRQGVGLDEISGALATTLPAGRAVAVGIGNALKGTAKMAAGGYLGSKAAEEGARALHLPSWAQGAAQVVGAIYGAKWAGFFPEFVAQTGSISPGKFFQWMRARGEPIPGPYPVGKGTRTKYGGPAPVESGPSGKPIPRGKFTPPAEPVPETPKPYPAGKGTSTKYGGPTEPDFSPPARKLKLKGGPKQNLYPNAPEPEVVPKAPKPFKPSPAIARKLRFGGPTKEEYTPPPARTIRGRTGVRAGEPEPSPKTEQTSAQTPAGATRPEPPASVRAGHAGEDKPALRGAAEDVVHRNAQAKDLKMVEYFKSKGIDPDAISDADFNRHLAANGFKPAPAKYDPKLMRRAMSAVRADIRALMKRD